MVRSLTAEKQVENALKSILIPSGGGKCNPKAAVLIGYSVSDTRDHLLTVVPIPEDVLEDKNESQDISLADHAEKVSEMLPGGISILGIAIPQVSTTQLKSSHPQFKQLLTNVWKRSKCVGNNFWVELGGRGHQILLYYNKETKKFRFHWLQATEIQSSLQPGSDVKFTPESSSLLCVESNVHFPLRLISSKDTLTADVLKMSARELCNSLLSCVGIAKGDSIPESTEPLEKCVPNYKSLVKNNASLGVQLLIPLPQQCENNGPEKIDDGIDVRVINGIHCRAYLPITAKWQELMQALKLDGIKSLTTRKNLLLDELSESEPLPVSNEQKMFLSQRVCLTDPSLKFTLTDYATLEETDEDVLERVQSVWGRKGKYSLLRTEVYHKKKNHDDTASKDTVKDTKEIERTGIDSSWYSMAAIVVLILAVSIAIILYLL